MSLPRRMRAAYAAPGFAFALLGIPIYVHLPKFYGDTLGVDLGLMGFLILASRVWDAVTDPAIGHLSDRARTPFGRRRPFVFLGAIPLAAGTALLLSPPSGPSPEALGWWFGAWLFLVFLAWTAVQVPHAALGVELTTDYHERTSLFAARDGLWILGTLVAAAAPSLVRTSMGLPADGSADREVFRTVALAYAPLLVALPWWCAAAVREPVPSSVRPAPPWGAMRDAWRNRPFRTLLLAYGVGAVGAALPGTLILFYVEHVLRAPGLAEAFLALYFVSGFAFLPVWTRVARRVGKKAAWLGAMAVNVGAFVFVLPLGPGDRLAYAIVCLLSGIGFGAGLALPNSLVSDAIDYDELRSGQRREGLYFGLWSIVTKVSAAIGAAAALPALKWAGYVPQAEQAPATLLALRVLYGGVPIICYTAGLLIAARFPIDEQVHRRIREGIARRATGGHPPDPLAKPATVISEGARP
jgi:GPH family glycoside/pentoside/hexuronide:cation symporter